MLTFPERHKQGEVKADVVPLKVVVYLQPTRNPYGSQFSDMEQMLSISSCSFYRTLHNPKLITP